MLNTVFAICIFMFLCLIAFSIIIVKLVKEYNQQDAQIIKLNQQLSNKQELDTYKEKQLQDKVNELTRSINTYEVQADALSAEHDQLLAEIAKMQIKKMKIESDIEEMKTATNIYIDSLDKAYSKREQAFDEQVEYLNTQFALKQNELNKIKATLAAGVEAQLREEEKKKKIDFYKITLTANELNDIELLNSLRNKFKNVTVLNKLIWSEFLQKKVSELSTRIVGKTDKIGIYKITNLKTQQCYIGQSVSIGERFKQHCKCGCGIGASASNKLYLSMQEDGIWNFSFEVLEECPREQLNEKEKLWIELYQSNIYGLNSTKGGS